MSQQESLGVQLHIFVGAEDAWQTLGKEEDKGWSWRRGVTADKPRMGLRERSKKRPGRSRRGKVMRTWGWETVLSASLLSLQHGFKCVTSVIYFFHQSLIYIFSLHYLGALKKVYINNISSCMAQFISWDTFKLLQQFKVIVTLLTLSVSTRFKESGLQDIPLGLDRRDICGYSPHAAVVLLESFPQPNSFIYMSQCVLTET